MTIDLIAKAQMQAESGDAVATLSTLKEMLDYLVQTKSVEFATRITDPATFTNLRTALHEKCGVDYRTTQVKNRMPNKFHRASMFLKALIMGTGRVVNKDV